MDFAVPVNQSVIIKENEKIEKYFNLFRELKKKNKKKNKQWNMWVTVIIVDALRTVSKDMGKRLEELDIRGRIEIIHITV